MTAQDLQHPQASGADVLYQDGAVIVIDKPAGVAVSRGRAGGPSVDDWLEGLRQGKRHLPQPAHRLDADTSGCLALGRTKPAMAALGALFAGRTVEKVYWAVVVGGPAEDAGVIDAPLLKISSQAAGWRMVVDGSGQPALTRWRVMGRGEGLTWLELTPETGRTHQLRVHCASQGWPILGDAMYATGATEPVRGAAALGAKRGSIALGPIRGAPALSEVRGPAVHDVMRRSAGPVANRSSTAADAISRAAAAPEVRSSRAQVVIGSATRRVEIGRSTAPVVIGSSAASQAITAAAAPPAQHRAAATGNLHLLARRLAFTLEKRVDVEAPVPPAMQPALRLCGW